MTEENSYKIIAAIIIIALLIIIFILYKKSKKIVIENNENIKSPQETKVNTEQIDNKNDKNNYPFKKVYLLTKNEWTFYKKLKTIIDEYNLNIIAKIRLADLIEVDSEKSSNYEKDFDKIKSKHIDFAIVKSDNMEVKFLIELDDNSHRNQDRLNRDLFINKLCKVTGYKLIRTFGNTNEIEKELNNNYFAFKKQYNSKNNAEISNEKYDKILKLIYTKISKIEKILSDVDTEPYVIEEKETDS